MDATAPGSNNHARQVVVFSEMGKYLFLVVLFILCWPVALLALVLYPVVWLLLLPFRLVGLAVEGVFQFLRALFLLPARLLGAKV